MMIPFLDLKSQYQSIKDEIDAAIMRVLKSGQFVLGEDVVAFEKEFAVYCGDVTHGIAVNSGTSALHLALLAAGVGPGDEVITVPFTFIATVSAVDYTGARPVFVDVDPKTRTMDPNQIEDAITSQTKAILPVHIHGHPADMDPILEIARRRGLLVIEDAAQAHGAEYKGRRCGSMGDLACFSFYPGKNLGAYGEGGMVLTNKDEYARKIRLLRDWGQEHKYAHILKGFNYRMEALQGAILRVKLRHLDAWTEARRAHARAYAEALTGREVSIPYEMPSTRHVYHVYGIRVAQRDEFQKALQRLGIQTSIHYPIPVHLQPAFAELEYVAGDFPHSEAIAAEELSLPMYAELSADNILQVAEAVSKGLTQLAGERAIEYL
jgi:dTDP-4-amino-4,6-dideoxygalactose transaminase